MKIIETPLKDAYVIEPTVFNDKRGYFFEGFAANKFKEETNIDFNVVQLNFSKSSKGTLRGLHFQKEPMEQAKLVSVIAGEVWDIAVDLRIKSPTYGKWHGELLSSNNKKRFFIPRGFAHGFIALTEETELMYAVDNFYSAENDCGVKYNDSELNIDWKLDLDTIIVSSKDENLTSLKTLQGIN